MAGSDCSPLHGRDGAGRREGDCRLLPAPSPHSRPWREQGLLEVGKGSDIAGKLLTFLW